MLKPYFFIIAKIDRDFGTPCPQKVKSEFEFGFSMLKLLSHEKAPSGKMKRERKVKEKAFTGYRNQRNFRGTQRNNVDKPLYDPRIRTTVQDQFYKMISSVLHLIIS